MNELKFNAHVSALCKRVNFQLLTLKRMSRYMDTRTKLTIFKSFIASNFSYCCHIWFFCSPTLKTRLEKIQYRGLRYVYNDYSSSYDALLVKSEMCTIELLLQKTMLVEIFKCVHGIGASYLADLFKDLGHFPLTHCLHLKYISNMSGICPEPYFQRTNDLVLNWTFWYISIAIWMLPIYHGPLWEKNTTSDFTWFTHLTKDYFCMKKFILA